MLIGKIGFNNLNPSYKLNTNNNHTNYKTLAQDTVSFSSTAKLRGILKNFIHVDEQVLRAAEPSPEGIAALKKHGVEFIVDFRNKGDKITDDYLKAISEHGIKRIHCPLGQPIDMKEAIPSIKNFFSEMKNIKENGHKVLLHCHLGQDRTGAMVDLYNHVIAKQDPDKPSAVYTMVKLIYDKHCKTI